MSRLAPLLLAAVLIAGANAATAKHYRPDWHRRYMREHAHVQRLLEQLRHARHVQTVNYWRAKQIQAAETIGREALNNGIPDPWPHCPDPIFDGAPSWEITVACENAGSWMDSAGFYRCGLQFSPSWEQRFGRLCP